MAFRPGIIMELRLLRRNRFAQCCSRLWLAHFQAMQFPPNVRVVPKLGSRWSKLVRAAVQRMLCLFDVFIIHFLGICWISGVMGCLGLFFTVFSSFVTLTFVFVSFFIRFVTSLSLFVSLVGVCLGGFDVFVVVLFSIRIVCYSTWHVIRRRLYILWQYGQRILHMNHHCLDGHSTYTGSTLRRSPSSLAKINRLLPTIQTMPNHTRKQARVAGKPAAKLCKYLQCLQVK